MTSSIHGLCRFLFVFSVLLNALVSAPAQQAKPKATPPPVAGQDPDSITTFIRRVRLLITVVDKKGQFVSGLSQSDFLILEDKLPQKIETFSDDLGQVSQLYVAVLMDTSPSTAT